ncbi:hypothetical protein [Nocardia camponoti]|uniref:Lipoprotein n=1 Tax=Nocardia camponoti TaxID=1616106 RepID=A0A917QB13_9NOCA|nr:hypothetical protein [Nocardia camponoti]GGK40436.1 hypothetical protein GCM10011591_10090 [Nocardia camponoti]
MTTRTRIAAIAVALVLLPGLAACGKNQRWCERDQGDVLVSNSYCEKGIAGYEWEPDHDKPKYKKKPNKKKVH